MQPKLIALDVDGTLLTDNYQILESTKQALRHAQQLGIRIVLATGRGPKSCYPLVEELQLEDYLITHNGAVIVDTLTKQTYLELGIPTEELRSVIQYCREQNIHFDSNTAFDMYIESINPEAQKMYQKFYMRPNQIKDIMSVEEQIAKFTLFGTNEEMNIAYPDILRLCPKWTVIRSGETFIDIIHPQAAKGHALSYLIDLYNLHTSEVIAFGNYYNDLDMLKLAGLGVAMANSPQEVQNEADRITLSNNENGIGVLLEELLEIK